MKNYYSVYLRFSGAFFFLGIFLWLAKGIGFDFGLDLSLYFKASSFLLSILILGEIKKRRVEIGFYLKDVIFRTKNKFLAETKGKQSEIISHSPKIMAGKIGSPLILSLAAGYVLFRLIWKILVNIFVKYIFYRRTILFLGLFGILAYIFLFGFTSNTMVLVLAVMLIWSVWKFRFKGKLVIAGGLVFLTMCPFFFILKSKLIAEKLASWAYVFLVVGTCRVFIENFKEDENVAKEEK